MGPRTDRRHRRLRRARRHQPHQVRADNARVDLIKTLGAKGYGKQILLGTDSGKASYQKAYGSVSGIDYDPAVFCPRLIKDEGVDPAYVQDLLVGNAATFFAFEPLAG